MRPMGLFKRRKDDEQQLLAERAAIVAQLEAAREQAAWQRASDDKAELADARSWQRQADALQHALDELDIRLLRVQLDNL